MTTRDITTFLFPDTYLFEGGDPNNCCVLGFHSFDFEPGTTRNGNLPRFYMMIYASWVSPGLFGTPELGFEDVVALSHEMAQDVQRSFRGVRWHPQRFAVVAVWQPVPERHRGG